MKYHVQYKLHAAGNVNDIMIDANNKRDAYWMAIDQIAEKEGYPYSAWVVSVYYKNGNARLFNNHEGNPY